MGKKVRKEREEKREDFAAKRSKQKRKNQLIAGAIIAGIAIIVANSAYNFAVTGINSTPGAPDGAGRLGDEHEHASILVRIFKDKFDFSLPAYQIKSSWIHFEGQDGNTIHRHSSGVTLEFLFDSLGLQVNDECYIFKDGRKFCTNDDFTLKFYLNHDRVGDLRNHVIQGGDRILITYGDEPPEEIERQLVELDSQIIAE